MTEPQSASNQEQPRADAPQKPAEVPPNEGTRNLETKPSADRGGASGNNQPPPNALPPSLEPDRWYRTFSRTDWITAISALITALATVVIMVWAGLQWYEMYTGGVDTRAIAEAAKQQACAAKSFAASADSINLGVGNAVGKLAQQANDAETFFRTDERAWVEIGKIEIVATYPPESTFGRIFKYGIYTKNDGKTVARDVRIHINNLDNVGGDFEGNKKAIRMFQNQLFRESGTRKRVITPDIPGPQTIAPGELSPVPVYSGGQEPMKDHNIFRYSFILGRIDYIDAFSVKHWMRFCYMVSNSQGELGHCQFGNDEDNSPEIPPQPPASNPN